MVFLTILFNFKKENFKDEICYKTYIPKTIEDIMGIFDDNKIDYNKFLTKTSNIHSIKKDFSPEALNFHIGINSR